MKSFSFSVLDPLAAWLFPRSGDETVFSKITATELGERTGCAGRPVFRAPGIRSLFNYQDPLVRSGIWLLKYKGYRNVADLFGQLLYEAILDELSDATLFSGFKKPLLIPLPLSRERLRERGWNQSDMLARDLKKKDEDRSFEVDTAILAKIRHTPPQTSLGRKARLENLKDCFAIKNPEKVSGRDIILIDDVTTTGATLSEASRTLQCSGARKIISFTVAH